MSFESINNRLTQIENRVEEINSYVNVPKGQKTVQKQIGEIYEILVDFQKRLTKLENK
jgi:tetrahydromethanopterin S-methyltransferase subunit G